MRANFPARQVSEDRGTLPCLEPSVESNDSNRRAKLHIRGMQCLGALPPSGQPSEFYPEDSGALICIDLKLNSI